MAKTIYYSIKIVLTNAPAPLFIQQNKGEMYLSSNVRLSGLHGMAYLASAELAEEFLKACLPRLRKRYGDSFSANVCKWAERGKLDGRTTARIQSDSDLVRKRIHKDVLAPNQIP